MKIFESRCYNGGNQHKFSPRYDEVPYAGHIKVHNYYGDDYRAFFYYQVYVKDICEWCGKEIKK